MRFNRLLVGPLIACGLVAMAACSGGSLFPSSPEEGSQPLVASSGSISTDASSMTLVYCKPFDEASKSAKIGVEGGTITVGPHNLWIPPGALLSPTTITAKIAKNDYSHSVELSPAGLRFTTPAMLTLSYSGCDKQTLLRQLQVVYTSNNLSRVLDLLSSTKNSITKTTTGTISHFSRYAIAY